MLFLRKPSTTAIAEFLAAQEKLDFTYTAIGATATIAPLGYALDHTRVKLGEGLAVFEKAKAAVKDWTPFQLDWVEAHPRSIEMRAGQMVAVLARVAGLWWLNASRVIYVVDEPGRFGFAYGTLPEHAETGEERFLVEWDQASDTIFYDILAFSRPNQLLARLGYPLARRVQSRFRADSAAAMIEAVGDDALPLR
jgi:uncharacterized protein (UPF0548 family)